jgi:hypothetical protein
MTNASMLPRLSRDVDARMRGAIDRKSSIATHYIPIISVRNQQFRSTPLVEFGHLVAFRNVRAFVE